MQTNKRCFLDLDGVLCDFVNGACKLHGKPNPYGDPANHGVYAIEDLLGISRNKFYAPMNYDFWASLEPTPECCDIYRLVFDKFQFENVCILTSPILTEGCCDGKIKWIEKNLPEYFHRRYLIGSCKEMLAGPDAWLIDDNPDHCRKFRENGGNAILVPRPWNQQANPLMQIIDGDLIGYIRFRLEAGK